MSKIDTVLQEVLDAYNHKDAALVFDWDVWAQRAEAALSAKTEAQPVATFQGMRQVPALTREFWGWLEDGSEPPAVGAKLYTAPLPQQQESHQSQLAAEYVRGRNDGWEAKAQQESQLLVAAEKLLAAHTAEEKASLSLATDDENYSDHTLDAYTEAAAASSKAESELRAAIEASKRSTS